MNKLKKFKLTGVSHWSSRGDMESERWIWWLEVEGLVISDEEMREHSISEGKGVGFIKEILPFLPENIGEKVEPPNSIPGGECYFSHQLEENKNPEEVEKILVKYFPELISFG